MALPQKTINDLAKALRAQIAKRDAERDEAALKKLSCALTPRLPRREFGNLRRVKVENIEETREKGALYRITVPRDGGKKPLVYDICKRVFWDRPREVVAFVVEEITRALKEKREGRDARKPLPRNNLGPN